MGDKTILLGLDLIDDGTSPWGNLYRSTILALDNLGLVAPVAGGLRYKIAGQVNATSLTTISNGANVLRAVPFFVGHSFMIDQVGIRVTTSSYGSARIGIYKNSGGIIYPGSLVLDAGEVSHASTGARTINLSEPVELSVGLYWAVLVTSGSPTLQAIPVSGLLPILGFSSITDNAPGVGWYVSFTYNQLPEEFPSGASAITSAFPAIYLRVL